MADTDERQNTVALTVDGAEVTVPRGTTVIEAAERAGVVVPHYCYHPGIPTRPAQCRMCLVEVEGEGKLQPSCVLDAQDGMVVHTDSDRAELARKSVIEFLLLNHPLDCPICDAAGQCMLQDYAFETGQLQSRLDEEKLVMGRDRISDDIMYFADRCIICTRCVRFMREVAGDDALVVANRGDKAYIDTAPGEALDHPFQGNIVDVCPVGALVHEDYLFKPRYWDLDETSGVCPGCPTGCNVSVGTKENQIVRLKPRHNQEVNSYWMCDYGRKHLVMANRGVRTEVPLLRRDDELVPVDWEAALEAVSGRLAGLAGDVEGQAVVSPAACNESLFFFRRLLERAGIDGGCYRVETGGTATLAGFPKLKLREERAPNPVGAELFGFGRVDELPDVDGGLLAVLEEPLEEEGAGWGEDADWFLYLGSRLSPAARNADAVLPVTFFAEMEGTFTNFEGRVQRFRQALQPQGVARPAWMVLSRLLQLLGEGETAFDGPEAFGRMARGTPAMEGMSWAGVGTKGATIREDADAALAGEGA
ncbi:MAG: 2Fe-2S iron-sulfur cluster-binding protein [Gemmatimonadota bacterium]